MAPAEINDSAAASSGGTPFNGRLPPELVQAIVRKHYDAFRKCYEEGLRRTPDLKGKVVVRFVIGRDGGVDSVRNDGSELPDTSVVQCILDAYWDLCFPRPEGGIITVVYPIMFEPGN